MAEPHAQTAARLAAWLARAGAAPLRPHQLHQLCRGKYGNVWESVMRQVLPRQMARRRRLQVLVQDVRRYRTVENTVRERMGVVVLPEELEVWRETQALREEVARAEARVASGKKLVGELADRVARKLGQRAALTESVEDARRRLCLLAATAERLQAEAGQLAEMTDCTRQLLPADTSDNAEEAIDKCLSILGELAGRQTTEKNAQADCTQLGDVSGRADREQVMSAHEKLLSLLARVSATELWAALQERQGRLVREMAEGASVTAPATERRNGAQSCIAETSALHCTLTLRALENGRSAPAQQRRLLQLIHQAQVAGAAPDAEARGELFILHCEKADLESRVRALRSELEDLLARRGPYKVGSTCDANSGSFDSVDHILAEIEAVDRECLVKKAGTEARMCSLERTSVKIASVCGQLRALFGVSEKPWGPGEPLSLTGGGKHDASVNSVNSNYDEFVNYFQDGRTGAAPERPAERPARARLDLSIFMRGRGGTQPPRLDLSLDLDRSGRSENTLGESSEPRFTDELRLFLSKFRLEKNRKIVLDSGESLWIFQTLDGLARSAQLSRAPLALAQTLAHAGALGAARAHALDRARLFAERSQRDSEVLGWTACADIDIAGLLEAGTERIDRLKKRLSEARASLERTGARLGRGLEDTAWWRAARPARCVAAARRLDGRSWREFEAAYADLCSDPLG